ncbi:MAG TPA: acetyl-CoA carboxylase carboxyltransferase subunit alpha/beta, partial [Anaerolineae bacterium]
MTARKRIAALTDRRSFVETEKDFVVKSLAALSGEVTYTQLVQEAQRESHLHESVITGIGKVRGVRVMLVVMDFNFMGGSMGAAAGEKIARAFELAAEQKIPLVAVTASGGARIYEGMVALMQMAKTAAAAQKFHLARLPFMTLLAHPTTGGVYASFANLADIIFAEPRALIGFAGPRVIEATTHVKLPADSHRAEFLLAHGMIDAIVPRTLQRATITRLLGNFAPVLSRVGADSQTLARQEAVAVRTPALANQLNTSAASVPPKTVWQIVELARHPDRPTSLDYFARLFTDLTELRGDRLYGDDPAIVGGIAHLNGRMVVVIGEERGHGETAAQHHSGRPEPEGYRKAWRLMRLAAKWNVPLVTLVDTPGADPSYESEKRGVAMAIA